MFLRFVFLSFLFSCVGSAQDWNFLRDFSEDFQMQEQTRRQKAENSLAKTIVEKVRAKEKKALRLTTDRVPSLVKALKLLAGLEFRVNSEHQLEEDNELYRQRLVEALYISVPSFKKSMPGDVTDQNMDQHGVHLHKELRRFFAKKTLSAEDLKVQLTDNRTLFWGSLERLHFDLVLAGHAQRTRKFLVLHELNELDAYDFEGVALLVQLQLNVTEAQREWYQSEYEKFKGVAGDGDFDAETYQRYFEVALVKDLGQYLAFYETSFSLDFPMFPEYAEAIQNAHAAGKHVHLPEFYGVLALQDILTLGLHKTVLKDTVRAFELDLKN